MGESDYRDDAPSLRERNARLEAEIAELRAKETARESPPAPREEGGGSVFVGYALLAAVAGVIVLIAWKLGACGPDPKYPFVLRGELQIDGKAPVRPDGCLSGARERYEGVELRQGGTTRGRIVREAATGELVLSLRSGDASSPLRVYRKADCATLDGDVEPTNINHGVPLYNAHVRVDCAPPSEPRIHGEIQVWGCQ